MQHGWQALITAHSFTLQELEAEYMRAVCSMASEYIPLNACFWSPIFSVFQNPVQMTHFLVGRMEKLPPHINEKLTIPHLLGPSMHTFPHLDPHLHTDWFIPEDNSKKIKPPVFSSHLLFLSVQHPATKRCYPMNIWNDKQVLYFDITKEQWCSVWDALWQTGKNVSMSVFLFVFFSHSWTTPMMYSLISMSDNFLIFLPDDT